MRELIEVKSDVHHIFPRDYLKKHGMSRGQYNQLVNYAVMQSEINIAIGNKEPQVYFAELREQCQGSPRRYGNITDLNVLRKNLHAHCIPESVEEMTVDNYQPQTFPVTTLQFRVILSGSRLEVAEACR
ncbi:MAG: hypothetical protein LC751_02000 [Actinobacteria bacterium]|nr:hypothetical protein [Actinomycetota bacterium]